MWVDLMYGDVMYGDGDVMYGDVGHTHYYAGSPAHPSCGTTNLHLDISDATNVMVSLRLSLSPSPFPLSSSIPSSSWYIGVLQCGSGGRGGRGDDQRDSKERVL